MTLAEEELAFYSEYGRAMGAWTDVEYAMYFVARMLFEDGMPRNMLGMGFIGIQGFRSKMLFVDGVVKRGIVRLENRATAKAEWAKLVERLGAKSLLRNDLAHYSTKSFENNTEGRRFAICPWSSPKSSP